MIAPDENEARARRQVRAIEHGEPLARVEASRRYNGAGSNTRRPPQPRPPLPGGDTWPYPRGGDGRERCAE